MSTRTSASTTCAHRPQELASVPAKGKRGILGYRGTLEWNRLRRVTVAVYARSGCEWPGWVRGCAQGGSRTGGAWARAQGWRAYCSRSSRICYTESRELTHIQTVAVNLSFDAYDFPSINIACADGHVRQSANRCAQRKKILKKAKGTQ
jgi:hypothetical protein